MIGAGKEGGTAVTTCHKKLTDLNYRDPDTVISQTINLMNGYNTLELKSTVVELKGEKDELIKLYGEIPISQHGSNFHITGFVTIWIEKNFPSDAPIIKLSKTNFPAIYFEPFLNTKQSTVIYSPYFEWLESKSTLVELVESVCVHLKQVCLGWVLSARDQEDLNWAIPPRLSMPGGFQPFQMTSPPNTNHLDTAPIGVRPPLNPGPMRPYLRVPALPPNQPHSYRHPPPLPPYPNPNPFLVRPPTSNFVSLVGPNFPIGTTSNPPQHKYPLQPPFSPPKAHNSNPLPPVEQPVEDPLNGFSPTKDNLVSSSPGVPASARKVTTKNI